MIGNIFYLPIMKTLTGVDAVNVVVVVVVVNVDDF